MEEILDDFSIGEVEVPKEVITDKKVKKSKVREVTHTEESIVNPLRNIRVIVRFLPKVNRISNPKHVLYGGMAENAVKIFSVPRLNTGALVNVLTKDEKSYLEYIMGLEYNALSVYNKVDNYWENTYVRLTKHDTFLNLADPEDYIKYKILLANKEFIAPSLQVLEDFPKETYQFVLMEEGEETKIANKNMSTTMQAYMEYGKIQEDKNTLRVIIEILDGRPVASNTKIEFLQEKINKLIQANSKTFLRVIKDSLLSTKVLIKTAIEKGLISNRGGMLYTKVGDTTIPLCGDNEEPTLNIAAKFLNLPKNQELKFKLEAGINK